MSITADQPMVTNDVDPCALTKEDLAIITGHKTQIAHDRQTEWRYDWRRTAQPVLDFLYLGPASMGRNRDFLQREGITMVLTARDSRLAGGMFLTAHQRVTEALGIATEMVDVEGSHDLIRAFPIAVAKINAHLLDVYQRGQGGAGQRQGHAMDVDARPAEGEPGNPKKGKVLVCCETGNERSAAVVAAYLMHVYGVDLIEALQFISMQRFCANFDDETKYLLRTYGEILTAKRDVSRARSAEPPHAPEPQATQKSQAKRTIDETMEDVDDSANAGEIGSGGGDDERYSGRGFAPFVEHNGFS